MKIDRINYKKVFNLGNFSNEHVGLEGEINEGEDILHCALELKKLAEAIHKQNNPHLIEFQEPDIPIMSLVKKDPPQPKTPEEKTIEQINEITDIKILKEFEFLAKQMANKHPQIKSAYENRLKQLTA